MDATPIKPWPNPNQDTTDDSSEGSSPAAPRPPPTIQASRDSSIDRVVTGVSKRSWADEASSVSSSSYSKSVIYSKSLVSFASATRTSKVIDVISEPITNADNLSILSDEEDSDPDVPSNVVSGSSLVKDANINADAHSNGYVPLCWKYDNPDGVASKAVGFGNHWTSAEIFAQSSGHLGSSKDDQKARERAAAEFSCTMIGRALEDASIALHSIQHAGPTNLHAGYGASQLLMPCSHPKHKEFHGDCEGRYFPNRVLPLKVKHNSEDLWCDVCNDCYNAFETDNPTGPGGTVGLQGKLGSDIFQKCCKHLR